MEKENRISSRIYQAVAVLLCLVLLSLWMLGNVYARYTTESSGSDTARVAAFVFQLADGSGSQIIDLKRVEKPGDTCKYHFTVSNNKDNKVNEVTTEYHIGLELAGSMPLECTVTEEDPERSGSSKEMCKVKSFGDNVDLKDESDAVTFAPAEALEKNYVLSVSWPSKEADAKYANTSGTSLLVLNVNAKQTD